MSIVPKPQAIAREALLVVAGAIVAAVLIGAMPGLRDWIKRQWDGAPRTF